MKRLITLLFVCLLQTSFATTYYVSNNGNDANNGTSTSTSWKTISKVNSETFLPGDSILFRKGDTWRETLNISSSGSATNYIVYSSYGSGVKPKLLGSTQATGWTNMGGNIWVCSTTLNDPTYGSNHNGSGMGTGYNWPGGSWFIETSGTINWGHQEKHSLVELTMEYDWWWDANHIYIYSSTDPTTRYSAVEVSQRQNAINLINKNYLVIDGLELHFQQNAGTSQTYPPESAVGLTIKNCKISHIGIKGGTACGIQARYSNLIIQNNDISECGRRAISLNDGAAVGFPIFVQNIIIDGNVLHNGYHTTGVDIQVTVGGSITRDITISNNIIYDDPQQSVTAPEGFSSNLLFISEQSGSTGIISNVKIHNNVFKYPTFRAIHIDGIDSCYIYNNTIYGSNSVITSNGFGMQFDNAKTHAIVKNNIFYGNSNFSLNTGSMPFYKSSGATSVISDHNLFYQQDPLANLGSWNGTLYKIVQFASYQSSTSQDIHSNTLDPLFVSSSDYHLLPLSPAIDAGVDVGLPFSGAAPDMGAFEAVIPPIVNAGADQTVCAGTSITLTADNPDGAVISWNNGVNDGVSFTPITTQTYTVTADLNGFISTDSVTITVDGCVGLTGNILNSVTIAPNPASDYIHVNVGENNSIETIQLISLEGQTIAVDRTEVDNHTTKINVSSIAKGAYFIHLTTEKDQFVKKIVIQ